MARPISKVAPAWWDYTTLDEHLLADAAKLTPNDLVGLSRDGFAVTIYDTLEEFFCAEALEYIQAWQQSTPDNPAGICGPIGQTEQLPLVARIVNALEVKLQDAHFWGMDEWIEDGRSVPMDHPSGASETRQEGEKVPGPVWHETSDRACESSCGAPGC
jgi:glucosamine-6-phosphate deaminase